MNRADMKRAKLVEAARDLFREQGIEQSTIAAIAKRAGVPTGGVFYHFPSKDDLINAVTEDHLNTFERVLEDIDKCAESPRGRLEVFLDVTDYLRDDRARLGCPVAKLILDVMNDKTPREQNPAAVFQMVIGWLEQQFLEMGLDDEAARMSGLHMFASVQGAFLLAFALGDPGVVSSEVSSLHNWLEEVVGHEHA